jgi:hypothetical protein
MRSSAPYLFFYSSNAQRFYLSVGKLCSLMPGLIKKTKIKQVNTVAYFLSTQTVPKHLDILKKWKYHNYHTYMIYTNDGCTEQRVSYDVILIDHGSQPMKALEFLTLLYNIQ